ncbi:hypothetical protein PENTCL1PPCAC_3347, partial [Pristionchus entomophagus]
DFEIRKTIIGIHLLSTTLASSLVIEFWIREETLPIVKMYVKNGMDQDFGEYPFCTYIINLLNLPLFELYAF